MRLREQKKSETNNEVQDLAIKRSNDKFFKKPILNKRIKKMILNQTRVIRLELPCRKTNMKKQQSKIFNHKII